MNRYLDRRGFLALLRSCRDRRRVSARRDHFLIYLLGRSGLRCAEALALRVQDLSLDTDPPYLNVRTLKQRREQIDQVVLEPRVVRRVRRYLGGTLPRLLHRATRKPWPDDPLFPSLRRLGIQEALRVQRQRPGYSRPPMSPRNARRIFELYRKRAGLRQGITLHSLRHFRGSELLRASKDLRWTQQQLRHRFISSTQRYLHVDPELERRYLKRLDKR